MPFLYTLRKNAISSLYIFTYRGTLFNPLMFERTRMMGLIASLILMTLFTIYTGSILLHFFAYVPCSCGGVIRKLSWPQHMVFNLFFVALSIIGIILQRKHSFTSIFINPKTFT